MGALCGIWPGTLMIYRGGCLLGRHVKVGQPGSHGLAHHEPG